MYNVQCDEVKCGYMLSNREGLAKNLALVALHCCHTVSRTPDAMCNQTSGDSHDLSESKTEAGVS